MFRGSENKNSVILKLASQFREPNNWKNHVIYKVLVTKFLEDAGDIQIIEKIKDSENKVVIDDTMMKISELEQEYKNLKEEYRKNGYNKFIINAMIYNFQQRIEVLQLLQQTIEHKNNFKKVNNFDEIDNPEFDKSKNVIYSVSSSGGGAFLNFSTFKLICSSPCTEDFS